MEPLVPDVPEVLPVEPLMPLLVPVEPVEPPMLLDVPVLVLELVVLGDEVLVEPLVLLLVEPLFVVAGIVLFEFGTVGDAPVSGPVVPVPPVFPVLWATATPATTTRQAAAAVVRRVTSLFIPGAP